MARVVIALAVFSFFILGITGHVPDFLLYSFVVIFLIFAPIYFLFVELPYRAAKQLSHPVERLPIYSRETGELLSETEHKEMDDRFRQSARNQQFWLLRLIDRHLFALLVLSVIVLVVINWLAVLG